MVAHSDVARVHEITAGLDQAGATAAVQRGDYRPYPFAIDLVDLQFELAMPTARIAAGIEFRRLSDAPGSLILNGVGLRLLELRLDGAELPPATYQLGERELVISNLPARGRLHIVADVDPGGAGSEGLICIDDVFVTHCEPEGFRRIAFFPDRPDVLARYRCTLIADAERYPTLLSNGHLTERGALPGGRHYARWEDPFPKACYLFALVAGRLAETHCGFVTRSGRPVDLRVHCLPDDVPYCAVGLDTLLKAIRWDEQAYGREYDLDVLNVAVLRSYPGGGMENKGLNLYSTEFFLTAPDISTDEERRRVQAVIAHEYFHNWTGNRVGCRSWFELSLKEGFTIFRQQQFMATLLGEADARIDDVLRLEELQYPEDDGGMAHAIRPESYVCPSNLYTKTVYEKGAEIIRMLHAIIGADGFRATADAFFDRFDGLAVGIDDLLDTAEQISGRNLSLFRRWYANIGCVRLIIRRRYDARLHRCTISFAQTTGDAGTVLEIPLRLSLLGRDREAMPLRQADGLGLCNEQTILLTQSETTLTFEGAAEPLIPLLYGFSAPVRLEADLDASELLVLASSNRDPFARWSAAQRIAELAVSHDNAEAAEAWLHVVRTALTEPNLDPAIAGRLIQLPSEKRLGQRAARVEVEALHTARGALADATRAALTRELRNACLRLRIGAQKPDADGPRRLRNACLWYLMQAPSDEDLAECWDQFRKERVLENAWSAARCLIDRGGYDRTQSLEEAHACWHHHPALLDHWFSAQAVSQSDDCADRIAGLIGHPDLSLDNSARLKATFDAFADNQHALHAASGIGYDTILRVVTALNVRNPRLAARFLRRFDDWKRFDERRRCAITERLRHLISLSDLAPQLREIATKSLEAQQTATSAALEERQ